MEKIEARKIIFSFSILCKTHFEMSQHEFKEFCKDPDLGFSSDPEMVTYINLYGFVGGFIWKPKQVVEAIETAPEVVEHCAAWSFNGGKYGSK